MEVETDRQGESRPTVIGVDFSDASSRAIAFGLSLAQRIGVQDVHVVHVVEPAGLTPCDEWEGSTLYAMAAARAWRELDQLCASVDPRPSVHVMVHVRVGDTSSEIVELAAEVDASGIILGARDPGGSSHARLGSVAEAVQGLASCPVVMIGPLHSTPSDYVLVVEDDDGVRDGLTEVFKSEGYDAIGCEDGQFAMDLLNHCLQLPRVIVLDFQMPHMDGWAFLKERGKSRRLRGIPVVGMSASQHLANLPRPPAGVDEFFMKPFDVEGMLQSIQRHW